MTSDKMFKQLPLVVILGATACGKSKLAIELARRFGGEIISADSMQVYKGLDIVTNKVTKEEQSQAKHHMIDFLDPTHRYCVVDFRSKSLDIIDNLFKRGSLPIVVGGTNYYIESLLWKSFLLGPTFAEKRSEPFSDTEDSDSQSGTLIDSESQMLIKLPQDSLHSDNDLLDVEKFFAKPIYNDAFADVESRNLWNILEKVDQKSAHLVHPNDKRRIIRYLQIIQEKRKSYSDILTDLNRSDESDKVSLGGPLRFQPTCVLWLSCEQKLLHKILDERVDRMFDRGLLTELENFHENYNIQRMKAGQKPDYEKGIFQTIGFKEFHKYLVLAPEVKASEKGETILKKAIEEFKISTRQYATRQLKWIKRRFMQLDTRDLPLLFKLNTSFDEQEWHKQVKGPAFDIIESLIEKTPMTDKLLELKQEPIKQIAPINPGKFYCRDCDRIFIGSHHIESHLKSRSHTKLASLRKKQQQVREHQQLDDLTDTATKVSGKAS